MNSSTKIDDIGEVKVRILVPSRRKDGKIINQEVRAEWEANIVDFATWQKLKFVASSRF